MDIYFYEVKRVEETLPEKINIDKTPLDDPYEYVPEDEAEDWQKNIGQKCTIQYETVNSYDVCKKLTGKEPSRMFFSSPWGDRECYDKDGNYFATITEEMLERFRYIKEVPSYVMEYDEDGFYSRLGFAIIDEESLTINYHFSYTSDAGHAKRSFPVEMNEENIMEIINLLESKLTMSAFTKEQRLLMTSKVRSFIKERDNYTCKICGNSIYNEPNLLLEVDHIIPVSKGGCTVEDNLQTLWWKCNRQKSNKL